MGTAEVSVIMTDADSGRDPLAGHPKYEKVRDINTGAFGFVQLAVTRGERRQHVAIKFLPRGKGINKHVAREILNHSNFCHPHVVQFKEVFLTDEYLAIAMEYVPSGNLYEYVSDRNGLKEEDARWFFQQLILGLDYCHQKGVVNRDIKLENTLVDNTNSRPIIKISDFGFSKSDKESLPKSKLGTPGYTAPEVISTRATYDGQKADIWSCGVMLYIMLFCAYPFERDSDRNLGKLRIKRMLERILKVDYMFPAEPMVSEEVKDLLRRIFVENPDQRISMEEIQEHPWYVEGLPPGSQYINRKCVNICPHRCPGYQKVAQIRDVLNAARRVGPGAAPQPDVNFAQNLAMMYRPGQASSGSSSATMAVSASGGPSLMTH